MKSMQQSPRAGRSGRRIAGRAQQDHILDPYQAQQKLHEPTACPQCGAVYHHGRWQWGQRPDDAHAELCPACRRIADALPAGTVTLHGAFALQHKDEIIRLARNEEKTENAEHPLNRIISIDETPEGLAINTTDIHLPRRLGEAVKHAFHGELTIHYDDSGYFVRVDWQPPG
jgi:NMD protein affecting ribosome stability and mRNA decay